MVQIYHSKSADCVFTVVKSKTKMGQIINDNFEPFNYQFEQRFQDMKPYYQENGLLSLINVRSFFNE